jgi:hypothetical protein
MRGDMVREETDNREREERETVRKENTERGDIEIEER